MVMVLITPGLSYLTGTECPTDGSSLTAESSSPSLLSGVASQLAAISSVTVPLRTSGVAGRNWKQQKTHVLYTMFPKFVDKLQKGVPYTKKKGGGGGGKVRNDICHQKVFDVHPNSILTTARFLYVGHLKSPACSAQKRLWRDTSPKKYWCLWNYSHSSVTFDSWRQSLFRRVHWCVDFCGGDFGHLLWIVTL